MTTLQSFVERGSWLQGLVGGAASLAVALPLTRLLRESAWWDGAILVTLTVVLLGGLLRSLRSSATLIVLAQAVALVFALCWRYLDETLWWGLPTLATLSGSADLLQDAGRVLQTYAAPAPVTDGVEFLVVAMVALTALSVDAIAVTGESPGAGGLPLAAAFLVSVSNTGSAMRPEYFAIVAVLWLLLVALQNDQILNSWSSGGRPARASGVAGRQAHSNNGMARILGAGVVVSALLVASLLPHLPPTFIADGLGRNPDARGGSSTGSVSFAETMDLAADLNDRSTAPVLRYRSTGSSTEPLRVTASSVFSGGQWQAPDHSTPAASGDGIYRADPQTVLAPGVDTAQGEFVVLENGMQAPHLATPGRVITADLGVSWSLSRETDALMVDSVPQQYRTTFLQLSPRSSIDVDLPQGEADVDSLYLDLDDSSAARVTALAQEVIGSASTDLEVAARIQSHLRSGSYTYSLTLAPGVQDSDPITHFLDTRQGYCVQFATAMVMMARSQDIPARMAVGFLPGEQGPDGTWTVRANDAHAWPELYLDGLGWTRFEPTPGVRAPAPAHSLVPIDSTADETPPEEVPTLPEETIQPPVGQEPPVSTEDSSWWTGLRDMLPTILRVGAILLALALVLMVIPLAGRRHRRAALRSAQTPQQIIEARWVELTRSLDDLGVPPPPERSPRQMRAHYREHATLDKGGADALSRVTSTLEVARYAPEAGLEQRSQTLTQDVEQVIDSVQESLPWNIRTHAALLPRSGLTAVRLALTGGLRRR